ncbi:MAG: hypothetical protein J6Y48_06545 [Clostridia bacterium]|nr:hypothetical protein [Clostridia bacterium]
MAVLIKSERTWASTKSVDEWMIKDENELEELPDTVGPGSVAYTAGLGYIAVMDEDGEWQEVGAEED